MGAWTWGGAAVPIAALLLLAGTEVRAEPPTLGVQVNRAMDRGVAKLKTWQNPDGSFQGPNADQFPMGETALALYALAKSQVTDADPAVAKAIAYVKAHALNKTYEVATGILALDALKDPAHDEWIRSAAQWLENRVDAKDAVWSYPYGATPEHSKTDLSNTQFAVLGLWAAERHGHAAKRELWEELARRLPEYQAPHGAFVYSLNRGPRDGSGSMTTAGLTVLTLARDRVRGADKDKPYMGRVSRALKRGWAYLERRFTVDSDLAGEYAFRRNGYYYFLYGLERVAALAGKQEIAGHDWYREGAKRLVAIQDADGAWSGNSAETAFALLFLRKATATQMSEAPPPVLEGPGVEAPAAVAVTRPGKEVPYVRRWLVLGPFPNPDDSALSTDTLREAALAPRAGQPVGRMTWNAYESPDPVLRFQVATGAGAHSLSYAFVYLHAQQAADVVLWFDHDDGARVYLDGRKLHERHFHEGAEADRRNVRVSLEPGVHRLLFKVEEWVGGTGVFLRLAHPDGTDAPEVVPSPSPGPIDTGEIVRNRPRDFGDAELLQRWPLDLRLALTFDRPEDLQRVLVHSCAPDGPRWLARSELRAGHPHPGATGLLALQPREPAGPAEAIRRVRLPAGAPLLRVRISGDPYEEPVGLGDFVLRLSLYDGAVHHLVDTTVESGAPGSGTWRTVEADLRAWAGRDVLLSLEVVGGGKTPWHNEEAFLDEFSVIAL